MNPVREVRHLRGMALQELAVKAKVAPGTLTMIERYGYCPGPDMRRRIAEVLGVTDAELFPSGQKNGTTES